MIGENGTILDLSGNFYSEMRQHAFAIFNALDGQKCFNEHEDNDHDILAELNNQVDEEYSWFRENAPWALPQIDKMCVRILLNDR